MSKGLFDRVEGELEAREKSPGLQMSDLLSMPEPVCGLLNWMIRQRQVSLPDICAYLQLSDDAARTILVDVLQKGYVREIEMRGVTRYRVRLAPKRGRALMDDLWKALDDKVEQGGSGDEVHSV